MLLSMVACGHQSKSDPFGDPVEPEALRAALGHASGACREPLRDAFERGEKGKACAEERSAVGKVLSKKTRERFGLVDQRRVDLRGVSMVVVEANACRDWPLRAPGYAVLTRPDAYQAGCRLRRYSGPLEVTALEPDGTSYPGIIELTAREGIVRLSFAEADAVVRAHGFSGLDAFSSLELGRGAWAGSVNLDRLREFLGLWHFVWVVRGRGSPGLFAALHPQHPRVGDAHALSVEMSLARQERDYLAVARGELSARRFLERYVWSPYRRSVAAMAGAPPVPTPQVEVEAAFSETDVEAPSEASAP
jgi:hypothetical protein